MAPIPSASTPEAAVLERVKQLLRRTLGPRRADVYLFGSWATGQQRLTSDIDVAIEATPALPRSVLAALREAFEESTIPYHVDVVDLAETDPAFRERVQREGVLWIASSSA